MTRSFDWIAHHANTRPSGIAQIDLATDRTFTWAQMEDRTSRLAAALEHDFGIGPEDRVAVLAQNNSNFFEVQFACWKLGAIFVPVNWRLTLSELTFIAGDCTPKVIVHDHGFSAMAKDLAAATSIAHRINWDGDDDGAANYEDAIASAVAGNYSANDNTLDTVLTIMYTSGTTGTPKGAMITQGMTLFNAINCVEFFGLKQAMVNLAFLPLFHTGGLNVFANPCFHFGGTNLIMHTFDPSRCLALLMDPELRVTHFLGVPANFLFMSQVPEFDGATFPNIEAAGVGGSPTPVPLIEAWAAKGLPLQQAFGMTETSPLVTALKPEDCEVKIGSAGLPAMHCEVRIVGEDGEEMPIGEKGELWVRGPNVTPGYWNRPEATAEAITDGWLHTGDAAQCDEDGFIYIVDRWKDMYISGGENVYPAEVEATLVDHPDIEEAAVISVPDAEWGEIGRAHLVAATGRTLRAEPIAKWLSTRLARYKQPRSFIIETELPRTASGKVQKHRLTASKDRSKDGSDQN